MAELDNLIRLQTQGITLQFGATMALEDVDFSVRHGEIHALLGENGAGKSTLIKVLSGALRPHAGKMYLDRAPYSPANPMQGRLAGVATIYQELSLAPHLTVIENICLGLEPQKWLFLDRATMMQRSREALAKLGHADIPLSVRLGNLSVSTQQLVEIARSIALGCRVLILDEPTSSLTRQDVLSLFNLLRNLKAQGYAIIYISHFIEEVQEIADRYTVLRDGRVMFSGDPKNATTDQIISEMIGSKLEEIYHRSSHSQGESVLEVQGLKGANRLKSASLSLKRGEVLGIAGLLGSGRTELVRGLFGLAPIRAGAIKILQYSGWNTPHFRWQKGVGFLSENRKDEGIALSMDVADNLILSNTQGLGRCGILFPALKRVAANNWINKLSIRCRGPQTKLHALSGGNQQKVAFARLLHHQVDVLIVDEPTRGIDIKTKSQIYSLIDELARQGKAILMISSYLPELLGVCDRIAVMRRGHLGPARNVNELTEKELMLETVASGQMEEAS